MLEIRWEFYPLVAQQELARTWLTVQRNLQLAPATIDAYGRNLNDYLAFCTRHSLLPETMTREHLSLYVQDLASRPNPRGAKVVSISSGYGLSRSTMQQRLTTVRLYHDYLIEKQIRPDNPVGRGNYVAGKGVSTTRRGLLPAQHKLPWIPSDLEWQDVLRALKEERLRNQVMLLLAYDGALTHCETPGSRFRLPCGRGQSGIPTRAWPFAHRGCRRGANRKCRSKYMLNIIRTLGD